MCKAPKPPKPKEPKKPQFLRNKYLDEFVGQAGMVESIRTGRSRLRIPLGSALAVGDRVPGTSLTGNDRVRAPRPDNPNPVRPVIDRNLGPGRHRR